MTGWTFRPAHKTSPRQLCWSEDTIDILNARLVIQLPWWVLSLWILSVQGNDMLQAARQAEVANLTSLESRKDLVARDIKFSTMALITNLGNSVVGALHVCATFAGCKQRIILRPTSPVDECQTLISSGSQLAHELHCLKQCQLRHTHTRTHPRCLDSGP